MRAWTVLCSPGAGMVRNGYSVTAPKAKLALTYRGRATPAPPSAAFGSRHGPSQGTARLQAAPGVVPWHGRVSQSRSSGDPFRPGPFKVVPPEYRREMLVIQCRLLPQDPHSLAILGPPGLQANG